MQLKDTICLGVAGNFAHHLEQAGELKDFENVVTAEPDAPKGIFPFYLPGSDTFLGLYSIGTETLTLPDYEANAQCRCNRRGADRTGARRELDVPHPRSQPGGHIGCFCAIRRGGGC